MDETVGFQESGMSLPIKIGRVDLTATLQETVQQQKASTRVGFYCGGMNICGRGSAVLGIEFSQCMQQPSALHDFKVICSGSCLRHTVHPDKLASRCVLCKPGNQASVSKEKKKIHFTLFSSHNKSLIRQQPKAPGYPL